MANMTEKDAMAAQTAAHDFSEPPPEYTPAMRPMRPVSMMAPSTGGLGLPSAQTAQRGPKGVGVPPPPQPARSLSLSQRRAGPPPPPPLSLPILSHLRTHRVILASASPRRRSLLAQVGLTHLEIWPSTAPEDLPKTLYGPYEYVAATARRKCMHVYQEALAAQEEAVTSSAAAASTATTKNNAAAAAVAPPHSDLRDPELVIAADTVVVSRTGQIMEKPRSAADHVKMLRHLRDSRVHQVLTAVCVLSPRRDAAHPGYCIQAHTEETKVVFAGEADGLTDDVIDAYVRTREGADKAGGYALQGAGGLLLVDHVEGCVDSVIGLPVRRCLQLAEVVIFQQDKKDSAEASEDEEE